jgi:tetratricopeptide (TPR) repeat protein
LTSRASLGTAYRDAGRSAEAIPLLESTLAARERVLGPDHLDTMRSRNALANTYRQAGRVAEAIPLIEQILAAQERLLGADHSRTLGPRNNLAVAYRDVGRAGEAIPLFEQNLAVCERLLGAQHPGRWPRGITSMPLTGTVARLADQVGGHLQDDGPELVPVLHLLQEEHAGRAHGEHGSGGAHPVAQRRSGAS